MKVRIICMGNELVCDDGIGIRVGRVLGELALPEGVTLEFRPQVGVELLDTFAADEHLVLVDATTTGAPPGACSSMSYDEVEAMAQAPFCSHRLGLSEVLQIARRLSPERLPAEVTTIGVEAAVLDHYGTELSAPVRAALPTAVQAVLRAIHAPAELVARGVELARECMLHDPKPFERLPGS